MLRKLISLTPHELYSSINRRHPHGGFVKFQESLKIQNLEFLKSPLESLRAHIKLLLQILFNKLARSFISSFLEQICFLTWIGLFPLSLFFFLMVVSSVKKPLADSSESCRNLLLALSSLKLLYHPYDPTTFPQIRLSWVCVNRKLVRQQLNRERRDEAGLLFWRLQPNTNLLREYLKKKKNLSDWWEN